MIVVKVGGSEGINLGLLCDDYAGLVKAGREMVLVHGGNHEANVLSERLGHPPRFVTSASGFESRFTDRETLGILAMIYAGKANKEIVELLQQRGINAVGISGCDGRLLEGRRKDTLTIMENGKRRVLRGDHTGKVEKVNVALLRLLVDHGYAPVISPLSISYEGEIINVDGDRAAALLAEATRAEALILLSNIPGLLKDVNDEGSLIPHIPRGQVERYMEFAKRRMKKKVMGAMEALEGGVQKVIFGDARIDHPITAALNGRGTVIG